MNKTVLKKRKYSKPTVVSSKLRINFFSSSTRHSDSVDQLLMGEKILAASGCGSTCGSGPKDAV